MNYYIFGSETTIIIILSIIVVYYYYQYKRANKTGWKIYKDLEDKEKENRELKQEIFKLREQLEDSQRIIDGMPPIPRYKPTPKHIMDLESKIHNKCLDLVDFRKSIILESGKIILKLIEDDGYEIKKIGE